MNSKAFRQNSGQTTVEYILLLALMMGIVTLVWAQVSLFITGSYGELSHYLSQHLSTGSCARDCYFGNYVNGYRP